MTLPARINSARPHSRRFLTVAPTRIPTGDAVLIDYLGSGVTVDEAGARDMIDAFAEVFGESVRIKRAQVPAHLVAFDALAVGDYFTMDRARHHWWGYKISATNFVFTSESGGISKLPHGGRSFWPADRDLKGWEIKPWTPPTSGDQLRELAVGDNFTVVYDTGVEHKGIKVDAERWFSYNDKLIRRIMIDGGAVQGTVTKS